MVATTYPKVSLTLYCDLKVLEEVYPGKIIIQEEDADKFTAMLATLGSSLADKTGDVTYRAREISPAKSNTGGSGANKPPNIAVATAEPDENAPICPIHNEPMRLRPAGTTRYGKPYPAFYSCAAKNPDGSYCNRKPEKN